MPSHLHFVVHLAWTVCSHVSEHWPCFPSMYRPSLAPISPFPLIKWPQKGWSSIFGPVPWLTIPNNSGHVSTENHVQTSYVNIGDESRLKITSCWSSVTKKSKWSFHRDAVRHLSNIFSGTELDPNRGISITQKRNLNLETHPIHI